MCEEEKNKKEPKEIKINVLTSYFPSPITVVK